MSQNISNTKIPELADKVLKGTATEEEQKALNQWYSGFDDSEVTLVAEETKEELRQRLLEKINANIRKEEGRRTFSVSWKLATVGTLILIATVSAFFIGQELTGSSELAEIEQFSTIVKTTSLGQKLTTQLPDGSTVRLNSGSSIKYSENFSENIRYVELIGEAYFDVVRNDSKPFVIETQAAIQVEVLGTSFNVKSYADDPQIDVAVKTGKVTVRALASNDALTLAPDEIASYSDSSTGLEKKNIINKQLVFGWIDGKLIFEDQDFSTVIKTLSRWFGVEFKLNTAQPLKKKITADCNNSSLKEVLESLSHTYDFKYEIDGKIVTINQ